MTDLAKTLTNLRDLVADDALPDWIDAQIEAALAPVVGLVGRWTERQQRLGYETCGCSKCGARFGHVAGLMRHGREVHGLGPTGKPHRDATQCEGCGVYCESETALFHHKVRRHSVVGLRVVGGRAANN